MKDLEELPFYLRSSGIVFNGETCSFESANYVILGIPYDSTVSFRPGTRFAPFQIRRVSEEIESYCLKKDVDFDTVRICDLGDVITLPPVEKTIKRVYNVISAIMKKNKIFIAIGGEHTVTLGEVLAVRSYSGSDFKLVVFDAHMDMREEYPSGVKLSHATVMRRIGDVLEFDNICFVGTRAVDREEIEFCRSVNFGNFIDADIINQKQRSVVEKKLKKFLHAGDKVLISIDMDVLDPAFAPGVSNPEPLGISPHALMNILDTIVTMQVDVLGFDIVEVSPLYDYGNITSFLASRIIKDMICYLESRNKSR